MSTGSVIDAEPTVAAQALACQRALVQLVADAGIKAIDETTMQLLSRPVNFRLMNLFGGGVTAHATTRQTPQSARVQNAEVAVIEEYLAAIDRQLKVLGGS